MVTLGVFGIWHLVSRRKDLWGVGTSGVPCLSTCQRFSACPFKKIRGDTQLSICPWEGMRRTREGLGRPAFFVS